MNSLRRWNPEDPGCRPGADLAAAWRRRGLTVPALALALAFAGWLLWSVVVVQLPAAGFRYTSNQLFWLTALPALCGATLGMFFAFLLPVVGGRRFTTLLTAGLLLPAAGIALAVQDPGTPFEWMVALALLCGLGWVPLILAGTAVSSFGMDPQPRARTSLAEQAVIFTRKPTWLACWLVLGSFGSLIGFAASLPLLTHSQFPQAEVLHWLWIGPFVAALLAPLGGWLADRWGSARVDFWVFAAMALAAATAWLCLPSTVSGLALGQAARLTGFLSAFLLLFAAAGLGTGSSFQMIGRLFVGERLRRAEPLPSARALALRQGRVEAAAALGFASAFGAYGGFFIPKGLGSSLAFTGSPAMALQLFVLFYLSCTALTWWACSRRNAPYPC